MITRELTIDESESQLPNNGEAETHDPQEVPYARPVVQEPPKISIADALARNAAQREQLIAAGRDAIQKIESARAESNADADKRIADIRSQIGEPEKTRKTKAPKAPKSTEAGPPFNVEGFLKNKGESAITDYSRLVARMEINRKEPYSVKECKKIFAGMKPGEVLAGAIAAKTVKKSGKGAGTCYTRLS